MTWHKEFLSENNKKPSLSTFDDLYTLIAEVYEVEKDKLFKAHKSEMELLREQFINEQKSVSLTLQAIPEISVTELGWTDVRTTGGQKVSGPEREQLGQFLKQIEGASLPEKVASLSSFYTNGPSEDYDNLPVGQKIAKVLSYLVFFKALTKVVSNFNAASAGFNFEAFLAVLLDGKQVPANTGTIADFTTGDEIPISLKLYNEKSVVVGGSFNDLVGDLVEPKFSGFDGMRYVVCMKSFKSSETGKVQGSGLDIEGDIRFFQFDFTLDNIANIISRSMDKSKICIQLPAAFVASKGKRNVATELPGASMPSAQDLEDMFIGFFKQEIASQMEGSEIELNDGQINAFLNKLKWSKRDSLFRPEEKGAAKRKIVVRGQSKIVGQTGNSEVKDIVDELAQDGVFGSNPENPRAFATAVKTLKSKFGKATNGANDKVRGEFATARVKSERNRVLKQPDFYASLEDSVTFYNELEGNPQMQKMALQNSRGMLETHQFDVNRAQVLEISQDLGVIKIGARIVQEMLNKMTTDLNEAIFDIFTNVKAIQDNTYSFMAGGLREDKKAKASIKAANAIAYKTEELRPEAD
jgi:hypothetical protein